jgi:hypothetical protein
VNNNRGNSSTTIEIVANDRSGASSLLPLLFIVSFIMSEGSEGTESPKLKGAALEEQRQRDAAKASKKVVVVNTLHDIVVSTLYSSLYHNNNTILS